MTVAVRVMAEKNGHVLPVALALPDRSVAARQDVMDSNGAADGWSIRRNLVSAHGLSLVNGGQGSEAG